LTTEGSKAGWDECRLLRTKEGGHKGKDEVGDRMGTCRKPAGGFYGGREKIGIDLKGGEEEKPPPGKDGRRYTLGLKPKEGDTRKKQLKGRDPRQKKGGGEGIHGENSRQKGTQVRT